jgi:hypothetical protein
METNCLYLLLIFLLGRAHPKLLNYNIRDKKKEGLNDIVMNWFYFQYHLTEDAVHWRLWLALRGNGGKPKSITFFFFFFFFL